jgi:hypothetical protein
MFHPYRINIVNGYHRIEEFGIQICQKVAVNVRNARRYAVQKYDGFISEASEVRNKVMDEVRDYVNQSRLFFSATYHRSAERAETYVNNTFQSIHNTCTETSEKVRNYAHDVFQSIKDTHNAATENVKNYANATCRSINERCNAAKEKTQQFIQDNQTNLFFIGCSCATAYFAPHLFYPAAITSFFANYQIDVFMKDWSDHNRKPETDPYKVQPLYDKKISNADLIAATTGAVNAIALGTIFIAGSWTVAAIPLLGGVAVGSVLHKIRWDYEQQRNEPVVLA